MATENPDLRYIFIYKYDNIYIHVTVDKKITSNFDLEKNICNDKNFSDLINVNAINAYKCLFNHRVNVL